jgi:GTP-binding protein
MVDLRHPPSKDDIMMYDWLRHNGLPVCVVGTKADKIPKTRREKHYKVIKQELGILPGGLFIPFSSEEGMGKEELWSVISSYIENDDEEQTEL